MSVSVNQEQRLFVIKEGNGFSCFGFDNCFAHVKKLSTLLNEPAFDALEEERGEIAQYEKYRQLCQIARQKGLPGTYFDPNTRGEVERVLENARLSRTRVILHYGDSATGESWGEGSVERGTISRSTGPMQVPILIKTRRSSGGGAILSANIIRIQDSETKRDLYRHPTFSLKTSKEEVDENKETVIGEDEVESGLRM